MQGWYWDYPKTNAGHQWTDTLRHQVSELGEAGITHLWIPPHVNASFGPGSNGYDPRDIYDVGEFDGPTGFGTREAFDAMTAAFREAGVKVIGDMIYNHRDGGDPEDNPEVRNYILKQGNYANTTGAPYPSDRFRNRLEIGGDTGRGAGTYFFKLSSESGQFTGSGVNVFFWTASGGGASAGAPIDVPNTNVGGGDCAQDFFEAPLNRELRMQLRDPSTCGTTEFAVTITEDDFDPNGDFLIIRMPNFNSGYTDHRFYGIWDAENEADIVNELRYQTFTDFTEMPSGQGGMNWENFKPNGRPTSLSGDLDAMIFFYDYDQSPVMFGDEVGNARARNTIDALQEWTKWNHEEIGIDGLRIDAVKHFDTPFMGSLLNYLHDEGIAMDMVVGESFDFSPGVLADWVNGVRDNMNPETFQSVRPRVFDFHLREELRQAHDVMGYDVRNLFTRNTVTQTNLSGFDLVTFLNNHDFRAPRGEGNGFERLVMNDPILGYTYLLTNNQLGTPTIFYSDYYGYKPNIFNYHPENVAPMKNELNDLLEINRRFIDGSEWIDPLTRINDAPAANYISGQATTSLVYMMQGTTMPGEDEPRRVLVAINFAGERLEMDINIAGGVDEGTVFTDLLANSALEITTVENKNAGLNNAVYLNIPARSYSVWVQGELEEFQPSAIAEVAIENVSGSLRVDWTLDGAAENLNGFLIERKVGDQDFEVIRRTLGSARSFTDDNVPGGEAVQYRVSSLYLGLSSNPTLSDLFSLPNNIEHLQTSFDEDPAFIELTWTHDPEFTNQLLVERSGDDADFETIATLAADSTLYRDEDLEMEVAYRYRIIAEGDGGSIASRITNPIILGLEDNSGVETVGIIGSATANGWERSTPMNRVGNTPQWELVIELEADSVKFRANNSWEINWGATAFPSGTGLQDGPNIPISEAGTYRVRFNHLTGVYSFEETQEDPDETEDPEDGDEEDSDEGDEDEDSEESDEDTDDSEEDNQDTEPGDGNEEGAITSLGNLDDNDVSVYPNPTTGHIQLHLPQNSGVKEVHILDISGRLLKSELLKVNQQNYQLDITSLPQGTYLLNIAGERGKVMKRVVKQ